MTAEVPAAAESDIETDVLTSVRAGRAISGNTIYVAPEAKGMADGTTADHAVTLEEAVEYLNGNGGGKIIFTQGTYSTTKIVISAPITFEGNGSTVIVKGENQRNNTGKTHGFEIASAVQGEIVFHDLTIKAEEETQYGVLALIWIRNTDAAGVSVAVNGCTLQNTGAGGVYREAISFEYASGTSKYYFDLSVNDCTITTKSYGIGSGLNNGNPDVSACTMNIQNTNFYGDGTSSIYNTHAPKAFKELIVNGCGFYGTGSGGIKYIYSDTNTVKITNNIFEKYAAGSDFIGSYTYAIMATTQKKDYSDARAYSWATEMSGNTLKGQNVIIAVASPVEVVWFPDGQAVNNTQFNNYGNQNITDEGTRYGISMWGGNKNFIGLTDFSIVEDTMDFTVGDEAKGTTYYYNTLASSGAYTNTEFEKYWTDENPRHCAASLAEWSEANAVTRWTMGENSKTIINADENGIVIAEDDIAKVEVNTLTGEIHVTPKSVGTTYLNAYVGSGETDGQIGSIPNAKMDVMKIVVKEVISEDPEQKPDSPDTKPNTPKTDKSVKTGDTAPLMLVVFLMAAAACVIGACMMRRRVRR